MKIHFKSKIIKVEKFEKISLNQAEIIERGREFTTKIFREKIFRSLEKFLQK